MKISFSLRLCHLLKRALLCFVFVFLLSAGAIALDGLTDHVGASDVAIVLGSKVNPDGTPSERLAARLDRAAELYQRGMFKHVIVSGGTGKEGFDEALVMKRYLMSHDIPEASILMDSAGYTTVATAHNSADLIHLHGFKTALIVTQYFHISRTRLAFRKYGIATIYTAHPAFFEWRDIYSIGREVFAFYYYLIFSPVSASQIG